MKSYKILVLLVSLVVLINYINYFLPDRKKLHNEIVLLQKKIQKEQKLNTKNIKLESLKIKEKELFFSKNLSYSQAMGKMQKMIKKSAKNSGCKVLHLKWAQIPASSSWYERLKMNLSLECKPKASFVFINDLRGNHKLFYIETFKIFKKRKKDFLQINMQIVGYRIKNEI